MTGIKAHSIVGYKPEGRPETDYYPTPAHATQPLVEAYKYRLGTVWEPACGDGAMSKVLEANGLKVVSTDLIDRGYGTGGVDFLETKTKLANAVITNPPFNLALEFMQHSLELNVNFLALFCKLSFLEGKKRSKILEKSPLRRVHVFRSRVKLGRNGVEYKAGGMIAFAWFVWYPGTGSPRISWI